MMGQKLIPQLTTIIVALLLTGVIIPCAYATGHQEIKIFHPPKEVCGHPAGAMNPDENIHLAISLPILHKLLLDQFLKNLYDPKSPDYNHFLNPQEFTERFGPTQSDYDAAVIFFKNQGFMVTTFSDRKLLDNQLVNNNVRLYFKIHNIFVGYFKIIDIYLWK